MTNHLGNVLSVVTDNHLPVYVGGVLDHYVAQVVQAQDYTAFGAAMEGRSFSISSYRFGFNGKENDTDWGPQLIQDYGFRLYNPALGRFLTVDPLRHSYPMLTPYQFASNSPVAAIDLDGLEAFIIHLKLLDQIGGVKINNSRAEFLAYSVSLSIEYPNGDSKILELSRPIIFAENKKETTNRPGNQLSSGYDWNVTFQAYSIYTASQSMYIWRQQAEKARAETNYGGQSYIHPMANIRSLYDAGGYTLGCVSLCFSDLAALSKDQISLWFGPNPPFSTQVEHNAAHENSVRAIEEINKVYELVKDQLGQTELIYGANKRNSPLLVPDFRIRKDSEAQNRSDNFDIAPGTEHEFEVSDNQV